MRFGKQRATLVLLFLFLPLVASFAFLQTPHVSDFLLKVSLKIVRFRTGIKVDAKAWSVRPITFSAALEDISLSLGNFSVSSPELKVQLSPLSLMIGRLHVTDIALKSPLFKGEIPKEWIVTQETASTGSNIFNRDLPNFVGKSLNNLIERARARNISFERLRLKSVRSMLKGYSLDHGDLEIENLEGGQARLDWDLKGLRIEGEVERVESSTLSLALIRDEDSNYFLVMPLFSFALAGNSESKIEANGRWPGDMRISAVFDFGDVVKWIHNSPAIGATGIDQAGGQVGFEGNLVLLRRQVQQMTGNLKASDLRVDDFHVQGIDSVFRFKDQAAVFDRLTLVLSSTGGDRPDWKNVIRADGMTVDAKKLQATVQMEQVGLCAILRATTSPTCTLTFPVSGSAVLDASLSPFLMQVKTDFKVSELLVDSEEVFSHVNRRNEILATHPFTLRADALIDAKQILFYPSELAWEDSSKLSTQGKIQFSPTLVDMAVQGSGSNLESLFTRFLDLSARGSANINANVFYSEKIPEKSGRLRVLGRVEIENSGIEGQNFGQITGPLNYVGRTLRIGPLRLTNGGGKATVDGTLTSTPKGSFLNVGAVADRLEVVGVLPESGSELFRGLVSGTSTLRGYTNPEIPGSLSGPIDLKLDVFRVFGVPFQRGLVKARYRDEVLELLQVVGSRENASFRLHGKLNPNGGSEVIFDSDPFKIRQLELDPNLEILQGGVLSVEGYWRPAQGWGIDGQLKDLKIAGAEVPEGSLSILGTANEFRARASLGSALDFDLKTVSTPAMPNQTRLEKLKCRVRDEGLYAVLAYLKQWKSAVPVKTKGQIAFDWTPKSGSLILSDLTIDGPRGVKGEIARLLVASGQREFSWSGQKINKNTLDFNGESKFSMVEDAGAAGFSLEIPLALLDLVVPNLKFINGRLAVKGQIPLPPDLRTIQANGEVSGGTLFIRGVGQAVEDMNAVVSLSRQQLSLSNAKAKLGSGEVAVAGFYKIDLDHPAANLQIALNRAQVVIMDDVPADVTGDLFLKGENAPYLLSGRVQVTNAVYSKEFKQEEQIFLQAQEPLLRFDLDADFGSNVQVKNSVAAVTVNGRLLVSGTDLTPDVQGKVSVLNGSIFANETEFKIIQGFVAFPGGTAMPQLNIQANTVIKNNNQDYKIEMRARGSSDNLSIEFSSEPALSNTDIVNLLAFGVLRPASEVGTSGDLSGAARIEMLQALFGQAIGKTIDRTTGFQVRFKSTQSGQSGDYIPKVTLVKKLSDRMTLTVGRNLDITEPENNIQVDYKLFNNVNLSGVLQQGTETEETSKGVDLRFRFEVK